MTNDSGNVRIIKDNVEIRGLNIDDIFQKPIPQLKITYIIIPAIILCLVLFVIVFKIWMGPESNAKLIYIVGFGSITWISASVQLRYKSTPTTTIVAIGCIVILLIAAGLMTPKDTIDIIRDIKK